jgi:signal transduction histidine kinase/CheY-like chemotaxis protein
MEFLNASEERAYTHDVWMREAWRFALTALIISATAFINLVTGVLLNPGSTRPVVCVLSATFFVLSSVSMAVLWQSERAKPESVRKYWEKLFRASRAPMQVTLAAGVVSYPLVACLNAFIACEMSKNAALYQCVVLKAGLGIAHEVLIFVIFSPLVLKFLHIPFRWILAHTALGYSMLVAVTIKASHGAFGPWRHIISYTWAIGFMVFASWYLENADRKLYLLRLEMEKRHVKQLKLTQLETKAAAEETLLSFLCHEIRNPYCSLLGYVEFIHAAAKGQLKGVEVPPVEVKEGRARAKSPGSKPSSSSAAQEDTFRQIHGWCVSVLASSRHMLELLDNVLDLSKLENKKMTLVEQPVNPNKLCEEVHTILGPAIKPGVHLLIDVDPTMWVSSDPLRWRQLLVNLLSNAFKFTTEGTVCVKIKMLSEGTVGADADKQHGDAKSGTITTTTTTTTTSTSSGGSGGSTGGCMLGVWISDTGCGVSPENATKLFNLFESKSHAFSQKGSGVGLVLSQHIVQLMGGKIQVESPYRPTPGSDPVRGTCSYFTIPIVTCNEPGGKTGSAGGRRIVATKTPSGQDVLSVGVLPAELAILVVEDEQMNRMIMQAKLMQLQADVTCTVAETAEEALELVAASTFDVIVMDQHLEKTGGVLTGSQATRQLRDQGCSTPIIMCSGNCSANDLGLYRAAGATRVWPKPYPSTEDMASDIGELLSS